MHKSRNVHELCIKNMALKGRSLPVFNHSESFETGNLTMLGSYTFTESSPYEDSYYYLMIISDSIIEVNVKVVTSGKFTLLVTLFSYINVKFINYFCSILFSRMPN